MNIDNYKILEYLSDAQFHSGEQLAKRLQTSRAAISKRIAKINAYLDQATLGYYKINSVTGKGYSLNNRFDVLKQQQIIDRIRSTSLLLKKQNIDLEFIPEIDSTNDYLIEKEIDLDTYAVCIAEQQLKGRGRNTVSKQKSWYSPFGNNVYCSIAWHYAGNKNALIGLSLVAGISVAETLVDFRVANVSLKWPNDVLIDGRKIAGILTESYGEADGTSKLIIGFGVNVHNQYSSEQMQLNADNIQKPWTNMSENIDTLDTTHTLSRSELISSLVQNFIRNYEKFISTGLCQFLEKWQQYDGLLQKNITVDIAGTIEKGKYLGINEQGALLVEINDKLKAFYSGEVSVGF